MSEVVINSDSMSGRTGSFLTNKLNHLFKGINWLFNRVRKNLVYQGIGMLIIFNIAHFNDVNPLYLAPYYILSFIGIIVTSLIFSKSLDAVSLKENVEEIKECFDNSNKALSDAKSCNGKFTPNMKSLLEQAKFVTQLSDLKDLSGDVRSNLVSLIQLFTPASVFALTISTFATIFQFIALFVALLIVVI